MPGRPRDQAPAEPRFRRAARADLPDIVRLLADDPLGAKREHYASPLPDSCYAALLRRTGDAP